MDEYENYKNSDIPWFDFLPKNWELKRASELFIKRKEAPLESDKTVTVFRNGTVTLRENVRLEGFTESLKDHGYQKIKIGDLAIHEMDAFEGAIGVSDSEGKCSPIVMVLNHKNHNSNDYSKFFFKAMSAKGYIKYFAKGIRERTVDFRYKNFKQILFPDISNEEATTISKFLNKKVNVIDNSVKELVKQRKLLEELKQATIHKAVTKGLDDNVEMKDSGVEWIGEIPKDWELVRWKNILKILNGFAFKSDDHCEDGVPIVKMSNLKKGRLYLDNAQRVKRNKSHSSYFLKEGDLLLGMSGSIENFAFVSESDGECLLNQRVCKIIPVKTTNKYISYFIQGNSYRSKIKINAQGTAIMNLSTDDLKNMEIPLPSKNIQVTIVKYLDDKTSKIDNSIKEIDSKITHLKEYKKTLINDAVTGKIKVYKGEN